MICYHGRISFRQNVENKTLSKSLSPSKNTAGFGGVCFGGYPLWSVYKKTPDNAFALTSVSLFIPFEFLHHFIINLYFAHFITIEMVKKYPAISTDYRMLVFLMLVYNSFCVCHQSYLCLFIHTVIVSH